MAVKYTLSDKNLPLVKLLFTDLVILKNKNGNAVVNSDIKHLSELCGISEANIKNLFEGNISGADLSKNDLQEKIILGLQRLGREINANINNKHEYLEINQTEVANSLNLNNNSDKNSTNALPYELAIAIEELLIKKFNDNNLNYHNELNSKNAHNIIGIDEKDALSEILNAKLLKDTNNQYKAMRLNILSNYLGFDNLSDMAQELNNNLGYNKENLNEVFKYIPNNTQKLIDTPKEFDNYNFNKLNKNSDELFVEKITNKLSAEFKRYKKLLINGSELPENPEASFVKISENIILSLEFQGIGSIKQNSNFIIKPTFILNNPQLNGDFEIFEPNISYLINKSDFDINIKNVQGVINLVNYTGYVTKNFNSDALLYYDACTASQELYDRTIGYKAIQEHLNIQPTAIVTPSIEHNNATINGAFKQFYEDREELSSKYGEYYTSEAFYNKVLNFFKDELGNKITPLKNLFKDAAEIIKDGNYNILVTQCGTSDYHIVKFNIEGKTEKTINMTSRESAELVKTIFTKIYPRNNFKQEDINNKLSTDNCYNSRS